MLNIPIEFRYIPTTIHDIIEIANTDIISVVNIVKQKICLICQNYVTVKIGNNMPVLPCKCQLCSFQCLDVYVKLVFKKQNIQNNNTYCLCGYSFNYNDFQYFYEFFDHLKLKDYKIMVLRSIASSNLKSCLLCLDEYSTSQKTFLIVKLKDKKFNDIYKLKEFKHLICEKCYQSNQSNYKEYFILF